MRLPCVKTKKGKEMDCIDSIEKTKRGFEESFRSASYYERQTRDEKHLELIMDFLEVEPGMKILDLGTGTGYLAFPFAERYGQAEVVGLDIVEKTLDENRERAGSEGLFFLSDPAPDDDDTERFADEYMQMKKDGHIKFYSRH